MAGRRCFQGSNPFSLCFNEAMNCSDDHGLHFDQLLTDMPARHDRYWPGANPTIASYNASVVNFYNATGSLARFENKNIIFYF
jgi:hypothetical protein